MNQSGDEQAECPLCMEPLEVDDLNFYPCTCGYQICRFCWNRIREGESGLCPACRKAYPENPADFTPLSQEQVAALKTEKRAREQQRRTKSQESRRQLSSVRVVQKNLVFVVGLPVRLADPEILKRQEYFGKYGKIHKVVINHSTAYAGTQGPSASAYVTYVSSADALRAIQNVNNVSIDGRVLKGSLGTTKYCANFMRNQPCPKPDCMYLHELGDSKASFTKEEMHQGLHQMYERKLHNQLLAATNSSAAGGGGGVSFIPTTVVTSSSINITNSSNGGGAGGGVMLSSSSSSTSSSSSGGKEAWPSLSPPPSDTQDSTPSPQPTPNPPSSQNGRTEAAPAAPTKSKQNKNNKENKDSNSDNNNSTRSKSNKENKKGKEKHSKADKQQQAHSHSNTNSESNKSPQKKQLANSKTEPTQKKKAEESEAKDKVFNTPPKTETEVLEDTDDRHSLLDSLDMLLDSHSLLEDDNNHDLLADSASEHHEALFNRHRKLGLPVKTEQGAPDNRQHLYANSCQTKDPMLRASIELLLLSNRRSEAQFIQNEMLVRQNHTLMDNMYQTSPLDNQEQNTLGFQQNTNILPPFGMRMDGTVPQNFGLAQMRNSRSADSNGMLSNGFEVNGLGSGIPGSEGRYVGEDSMDRFFLDFRRNQQMKGAAQQSRSGPLLPPEARSLSYIESQHRQALQRQLSQFGMMQNGMAGGQQPPQQPQGQPQPPTQPQQQQQQQQQAGAASGRAGGGGDEGAHKAAREDDLDFEWLMERQKMFAELFEKDMLQQKNVAGYSGESGECVNRRTLHPPPGFTHMNSFGIGVPRPQPSAGMAQGQGLVADWTQLDPAIVSGMRSNPLLARFRALSLQHQQQDPQRHQNGLTLPPPHMMTPQQQQQFQQQRKMMAARQQAANPQSQQSFWVLPAEANGVAHMANYQARNGFYNGMPNGNEGMQNQYANFPLPPGFSVVQPVANATPVSTECIESK